MDDPTRPANDPSQGTAFPRQVSSPGASPRRADRPPHAVRVLVVDDQPDLRVGLGRGLTRRGYQVSLADNGVTALAHLAHLDHAPDTAAVITDIAMPTMDGNDLAAAVLHRHPGIPVLFVTASPADPILLTHPLVGRLTKPVTFANLCAALEHLLTHAAHLRQPPIP